MSKQPQCLVNYHDVLKILETCDYPLKNKMVKSEGHTMISRLKHEMKQLKKYHRNDILPPTNTIVTADSQHSQRFLGNPQD